MSRYRFAVLGGDYRYKLLYDGFILDGFSVKVCGNPFISESEDTLSKLLDDTDILIGPIPTTKDNKTMNVNGVPEIGIKTLFETMGSKNTATYIGGVINSDVVCCAEKYNIKTYDFFDCEEVAIMNAIPTAEGAIATAIQESDITLFSSKALVLGYGRCGKVLANMLKGMGAEVYSTFRNEKTAAYIKAFGIKGFELKELKSRINMFDFIFNTIPYPILTRDILRKANKKCLIVDLAQAPGGTDFNSARDMNIRALYCPGLPGRVAPLTAAEILRSAVMNIVQKA